MVEGKGNIMEEALWQYQPALSDTQLSQFQIKGVGKYSLDFVRRFFTVIFISILYININ